MKLDVDMEEVYSQLFLPLKVEAIMFETHPYSLTTRLAEVSSRNCWRAKRSEGWWAPRSL